MAVNKDEILDAISKMTLLEVMELVSDMEKKFGVTAAAPVAVAAAPGAGAAAAAPAPGAAATATGAAAVTPNFFSMSETSSMTSRRVILEIASRISSLLTAI